MRLDTLKSVDVGLMDGMAWGKVVSSRAFSVLPLARVCGYKQAHKLYIYYT